MRYDISLKITYEYAFAASGGRHLIRMLPTHIDGRQHRISAYVDVTPAQAERMDRIDFFNNDVTEIAFHHDHSKLVFHMKAQIESFGQVRGFNMSPPLEALKSEINAVTNLSAHSPHHYLGHSPRVILAPVFGEYAKPIADKTVTAVDIVEQIGLAIHKDMTFDPEATTVDTSLLEAFEKRHGVCQDYTHIMIACLRSLGIPAGYVSGFIRTIPPEGKERLEGADAMHAWVRAWCGQEQGWIEYDPTNAMFVNTDHIIVGYGRDYDDVAPVKGVLKTFGEQKTTQAVDVIALND